MIPIIESRLLEEMIAEIESDLAALRNDAYRDELSLALTGLRRKRKTTSQQSAPR